jgi:hypothetical protein
VEHFDGRFELIQFTDFVRVYPLDPLDGGYDDGTAEIVPAAASS